MTLSTGTREYLLGFADDEHMIGARHTSWIGLGPFLEEDLAFCSIAQDELGHAIALYELLLDDQPDTDLDAFAMLRDPVDYRSCHLAERECGAWNDSLVRHWLYDRAEQLRWTSLLESSNERLAALAARALREEAFHVEHAAQFMARVAPSQPAQILGSITRLLPIAAGIWDAVAGEPEALADGVATASSAQLAEQWELAVRTDLADWNLDIEWPDDTSTADVGEAQGARRRRSDGFDELQADLRKVIDLDPSARW